MRHALPRHSRARSLATVLILALPFGTGACGPELQVPDVGQSARGVLSELTGFGSNPGGLRGYAYAPQNPASPAPLVLALHACTQTAADYQRAGWNELADRLGFYVLYPEQQPGNNALRCFNWAGEYGDPTNLSRGQGENQSIIQMIDEMKAEHAIDEDRIFIMGHSGGGAQTALMLATWPEVFAGGAMIAGIPYDCTTTFTEVSTCLNPGIDRNASQWGDRARAGAPSYQGPYPRVSIWHGSADTTVSPRMSTELMEQWTNVHGIDATPDTTATVEGHTREEFKDTSGRTLVEKYTISNMNHGTPVSPSAGCGQTGAYFLDAGICAVERLADFWGLAGGSPPVDTTPPLVDVLAPLDGATVSGVVQIQVSATDDAAVASVEIFVNGNSKTRLTAAPFTYAWNTASEANGSYSIRTVAKDSANNEAVDDDTTVTVSGGVSDTSPPTVNVVSPDTGSSVSGLVQVEVSASDDFSVASVELLVDGGGVETMTSPPFVFQWNSTSVPPGTHILGARATDASGNAAEDVDTTVEVVRSAGAFAESFSSNGPDMPGWRFEGFVLDATDHTGTSASQSVSGAVSSNHSRAEAAAHVSIRVDPAMPVLGFYRRLLLRAPSAGASASFQVLADGAVIVEASASASETLEADWTRVEADLSAYANRDVNLQFLLSAEDQSSFVTDARVWLDDLVMGVASSSPDTTPPDVRFTIPASAGATLSGIVTVKVDATDDDSVKMVLLFMDDQHIGTDYRAPFEFLWDTAVFPEGTHALTARAFDPSGNPGVASLEVSLSRTAPSPDEPPTEETVSAGKSWWGCMAAPLPVNRRPPLSALVLLGLGLGIRRRRSRTKA